VSQASHAIQTVRDQIHFIRAFKDQTRTPQVSQVFNEIV
jgi:hypothetical protein